MHTHILINEALSLKIVIITNQEELDFVDILDEMIVNQLSHAAEGIQKT